MPPSEVIRPRSNAAVTFLGAMAGNEDGRAVSSVMAVWHRSMRSAGLALATESYAISIA